jgi:hypothetical protein
MKTTRKQTTYNKVVNVKNNIVTVLNYIFYDTMHGKPFNGATGSEFQPISEEDYNKCVNMDEGEIAEHLIDAGFELPSQYKKGGFIEWAEEFKDDDKLSLKYDLSYNEQWDDIREQAGLTEEEAFAFNCVGGGRCFDKAFKGNVNIELSALIRKAEGGE